MKDILQSAPKTFWTVESTRIQIKPFPGRWPTRWRITFANEKKVRILEYIGKPNPLLQQKVMRLLAQKGFLLLQEFDQLGCFREFGAYTPYPNMKVTQFSASICYAYYPWSVTHHGFFAPWKDALYPARIYWGKGRKRRSLTFYSPFKDSTADEEGRQRCREFHAWLRKVNRFK